jgi:hypothetical protein
MAGLFNTVKTDGFVWINSTIQPTGAKKMLKSSDLGDIHVQGWFVPNRIGNSFCYRCRLRD